ncbi:hypothetical protein C8K36_102482 [Rhodococcus sp. OK519]|nr:hypothetical protein C8K36_102482 [Rhodococcus sp. OK519]
MNALEQLLQVASPGVKSAFAGTCTICGRDMYRRRSDPQGRIPGMVERHNSYRCALCYRKQWRANASKELATNPPPDLTRDQAKARAVELREQGVKVWSISVQIGRSQSFTWRVLAEAKPSMKRKPDGVKRCVGCGCAMRFRSEPESVGVLKNGRGRCRPCWTAAYRNGELGGKKYGTEQAGSAAGR